MGQVTLCRYVPKNSVGQTSEITKLEFILANSYGLPVTLMDCLKFYSYTDVGNIFMVFLLWSRFLFCITGCGPCLPNGMQKTDHQFKAPSLHGELLLNMCGKQPDVDNDMGLSVGLTDFCYQCAQHSRLARMSIWMLYKCMCICLSVFTFNKHRYYVCMHKQLS